LLETAMTFSERVGNLHLLHADLYTRLIVQIKYGRIQLNDGSWTMPAHCHLKRLLV